MEPLDRRLITLLGIAVLVSACSNQVAIREAVANGDGTRLDLGLSSCGGSYQVETIETADSVTVNVNDQRSPISFGSDDCQDGWTIDLSEPLGDRELIDGSSGASVTVRYEPWNQQQYTEAEYREALDNTVACILEADPELEASVVEGSDGPEFRVELGDVPDGQSRVDPTFECAETYLEPLRR